MKTKILLPFTIVSFLFIFFILYVGLNRSNIYIPETVTNEKIPTFKVKVFNSEKELTSIEIFENDIYATKHLWENHGVKVMPGSFMAFENNNDNPGKNYLRIALVNDADTTKKGLDRVSNGLKELV